MTISAVDREQVAAAAAAIARGEVIAIPTDTVYGLACDPANAAAVKRVYEIKGRPQDLELTLLAASPEDLEPFVVLTEAARRLAAEFWPGALSIVMPVGARRLSIPGQGATLSCRVPDQAVARALLRSTGPLATTSANRHRDIAARTATEVRSALGDTVALVLDGGPAGGQASTIIDCTTTPPRVLREGPIPSQLLFARLGAQQ